MRTKTIYICEKCGLEIEGDFEKMLDHEHSHTKPKMFYAAEAIVYYPDKIYPHAIVVEMDNGAKVQYIHPIEIEPPTEKESPQQED